MSRALLLLAVAAAGCSGEQAQDAAGDSAPDTAIVAAPPPADSLALSLGEGGGIWFTIARSATAEDGRSCLERGLEIRDAAGARLVPLLYTGEAPMLIDDSTAQVHLFRNCRPDALYLVNLRTGQPTPVR
ncbi:MAG TPA: hypothetical protein VFS94_01730 [Gemmatimonadales bacterium]|nr:hypothetical protein [Gemmatimonadales bacterium]